MCRGDSWRDNGRRLLVDRTENHKVRSARVWIRLIGLTLVLGCLVMPVQAEDIEKKFRIGVGFGFLNAQDEVPSDSANTLSLTD